MLSPWWHHLSSVISASRSTSTWSAPILDSNSWLQRMKRPLLGLLLGYQLRGVREIKKKNTILWGSSTFEYQNISTKKSQLQIDPSLDDFPMISSAMILIWLSGCWFQQTKKWRKVNWTFDKSSYLIGWTISKWKPPTKCVYYWLCVFKRGCEPVMADGYHNTERSKSNENLRVHLWVDTNWEPNSLNPLSGSHPAIT